MRIGQSPVLALYSDCVLNPFTSNRMLNTRDHASISSILQAAEVEDEMALN